MAQPSREDIITGTSDIIGIVHTPVKDVWRVIEAATIALRQLVAASIIQPPTVIGAGYPASQEGKAHFESMNGAATKASHYVRPSHAVAQLTPMFQVISSPRCVSTKFNVGCRTDNGYILVPFTIWMHFGCDKDFSQKLPGEKIILTWETDPSIYGTIDKHIGNIISPLGTLVWTLANYLDGVGYFNVDSGFVQLKTQLQY